MVNSGTPMWLGNLDFTKQYRKLESVHRTIETTKRESTPQRESERAQLASFLKNNVRGKAITTHKSPQRKGLSVIRGLFNLALNNPTNQLLEPQGKLKAGHLSLPHTPF